MLALTYLVFHASEWLDLLRQNHHICTRKVYGGPYNVHNGYDLTLFWGYLYYEHRVVRFR